MNHRCGDHLEPAQQWTVGPERATARFECTYEGCPNTAVVQYTRTNDAGCKDEHESLRLERLLSCSIDEAVWLLDCAGGCKLHYEHSSVRLEPPYVIHDG